MPEKEHYKAIITNEGILIFMIFSRPSEPLKPFLLYDGGEHAILYRREDETVALEDLDDRLPPILQNSDRVLIFEMDDEIEDLLRSYEAPIKHIKRSAFGED